MQATRRWRILGPKQQWTDFPRQNGHGTESAGPIGIEKPRQGQNHSGAVMASPSPLRRRMERSFAPELFHSVEMDPAI